MMCPHGERPQKYIMVKSKMGYRCWSSRLIVKSKPTSLDPQLAYKYVIIPQRVQNRTSGIVYTRTGITAINYIDSIPVLV